MVTTKPPDSGRAPRRGRNPPRRSICAGHRAGYDHHPSPTKGISRAFDSQEATQRLMKQIAADGTNRVRLDAEHLGRLRSRATARWRPARAPVGAPRERDLRHDRRRRGRDRDGDRTGLRSQAPGSGVTGGKMTAF